MVIQMDEKEIREARRSSIPEDIICKMVYGHKLSDSEREIIRDRGKVYVESHKKNNKWVKPQLRDLSGYRKYTVKDRLDIVKKYDVERAKSIAKIGDVTGMLREISEAGAEQAQIAHQHEPLTREEEIELQRFSTYMEDTYKVILDNLEESYKSKIIWR